MAVAGVSTNGVKLYYGVETTSGTKPSTMTQLTRINSIPAINLETQTIDASALEDTITRSIAGRAENPGTWGVVVNATDATITEWETLISAYQTAKASGKGVWFEVVIPDLANAFWMVAEPPVQIPLPEIGQNGLLTITMSLTINEYKGLDEKHA